MPGSTHWSVASITCAPVSSRSPVTTAATWPSRMPMVRTADGAPVPSNQRPLRMTVSYVTSLTPLIEPPASAGVNDISEQNLPFVYHRPVNCITRPGIMAVVTPLQRYIAEEIATDHIDGLLTRREALRRLSLLGIGAAAATSLIAACGGSDQQAAPSTATSAAPADASPPGMDSAVSTAAVTWAGPAGELQGAWAEAARPRGGMLVIHENKGLNDWTRSVAGRLAGAGYSSLAIDLLSAQGGTSTFDDPAEATAALGNREPAAMVADLKSGIAEVQRRTPDLRVAAIGFCMGGGLVWRLLDSGAPELAAAFPFYGPTPDDPDFSGSKDVAVLAFYGELDQRVNATEPAAAAALQRAGMVHELVTEPGANHAFFNDTGDRYDPAAAADAWRRVLDWSAAHVG